MNDSKQQNVLKPVTKENPCPHCGKPDWCYRLKDLTVCNREAPPAPGWQATSKTDKDGKRFYAPRTSDRQEKTPRPKQVRRWIYRDRQGNPIVRVCREDFGDGRTPKRWQEHWDGQKWVSGLGDVQREEIPIYKYQEIQKAIAAGQTIFIAEGEPACDALWELGIPATTNTGGAEKWKSSDSKDLVGAKVVLCPDRDQPGIKHTEAIAEDFPDAQWLYALPNSPFWYNLPASQGLDVADWIADFKLGAADIWEAVEPRREGLPDPEIPTTPPIASENYIQKCLNDLYSDRPWIALNGKLYEWTGTHYQGADVATEKQRISQWCNTTPVQKGKQLTYAYATPSHVENIWKWLLLNKGVSSDKVNPPGFNCLNGVVKINWLDRHAAWVLQPHNPKEIYTYVSEIEYDPNADPTECERMLSCLEPAQQKLFIQTMAASLDLETIRRHRGRKIKALLCKGDGNNGKDTLREAVSLLYGGIGLSDASLSDFAAYDRGRKFDLAKLQGARISWSSENSSFEALDRLQSLKKAITGESLDFERKGVDALPMGLATVFLFNVNEAPNLKAGTEAIQSRWAVLEFNKTYKDGADPAKGEIEADSRFRYDPEFLKKQVCPALLNKMLAAFSTLAIDGIDYSCTSQALADIQRETNHLWAFAQDVGLDYDPDGRVYINDLWERLQGWYIDNGTLEIDSSGDKEKKIWHDQPRRGDKNVKAPNQVHQRFAELFPKIKRGVENGHHPTHAKQSYLSGISFGEANGKPMGSQWEANGEGKNLDPVRVGSQLSQFSQVGEIFEQVGSDAFLSGLNSEQLMELQSKINQLASQADTERVTGFPTDLPTAFPTESQLPSQPEPERVSHSFLDGASQSQLASQPDTERVPGFPTDLPTAFPAESQLPSQPEPERVSDSYLDGASQSQLASQPDTERLSAPLAMAQELPDEEIDPWEQPEEGQESAELGSHNSQRLIDWVRYRGKTWTVARQENGFLWLRKSGLAKIFHKVPVSQVEIGGYFSVNSDQ